MILSLAVWKNDLGKKLTVSYESMSTNVYNMETLQNRTPFFIEYHSVVTFLKRKVQQEVSFL